MRDPDRSETTPPTGPGAERAQRPGPRRASLGLGLVLVLTVLAAGAPALDAPWIQGDEQIFIVRNSDVTGAGRTEPTVVRWLRIFTNVHEDLYQPIPILTYAVEWHFARGDPLLTRLVDLLLHAANALLVWGVLERLLAALRPTAGTTRLIAWALALFWAAHPAQVPSYVGDMCRTHLLSALFGLLSLRCHLTYLSRDPPRIAWFGAAVALLLCAMLSKPMIGWFLLTASLEVALRGRGTLRFPGFFARHGLVAAIGLVFAALTMRTSAASGMLEDTGSALFGGPVERSLMSVWLYLRNLVAPFWLATWYVPDATTSWSNPRVWAGALALLLSLAAIVRWARRPGSAGAAVGLIWFWALLAPVLGVVGARVAAANDRYLYQPLVGLLLAAGSGATGWLGRLAPAVLQRRSRTLAVGVALLCAAFLLQDRAYSRIASSSIQRARRVVELNPDNPRAMETLALAYVFATEQPTPEGRTQPVQAFADEARRCLLEAARLAEGGSRFFPTAHDEAAFHRRMSALLLARGDPERSLEHARRAHELEPDAPFTWTRLAHAYRALGRWDDALAAYRRLEALLSDGDPYRDLRLVEYGDLLLERFDDVEGALSRYRAALAAVPGSVAARLALARWEIRHGQGATGFELAEGVVREQPDNVAARLIVGEYHLRSHHWAEARDAYVAILDRRPLDYEALRGFHEASARLGAWSDVIAAWSFAARNSPRGSSAELTFRSFQVWASALAGEARAVEGAAALLQVDPNNRFACLANAVLALRAGRIDDAVRWIGRTRHGGSLPEAAELERGLAAVRSLRAGAPPLSDAALVEAAILRELGQPDAADGLIRGWIEGNPESVWLPLAESMLGGALRENGR